MERRNFEQFEIPEKTMDLLLCIIVACVTIVSGFPLDSEYIVPVKTSQNKEAYVYKNKEYVFISNKVTWLEAQFICGDMNGSLPILNDPDLAYFISEALSDSNMDLEHMWIGARRDNAKDEDGYYWISGEHLPRTNEYIWNSTAIKKVNDKPYPLWVNRTMVPTYEESSNCVAIGSGKDNEPYFIDLQCHLKRPFACERQTGDGRNIREAGAIVCNNNKYHIFQADQTWYDAAGYCAVNGMRLATVESVQCINKIGEKLLRVRPTIENAWIGGKGTKNVWTWLSSGKNISDRNMELYINNPVEKDWPPYRLSSKRKSEGCLLIDRRTVYRSTFSEALCDKKRSFVCMAENPDSLLNNDLRKYDDDHHMIIQDQMKWSDADKSCRDKNGTLASITDEASLTKLLLFMAEADEETVQHIWVSGILKKIEDRFQWYDPLQNKIIPGPNDDDDSIPWCDEDISPDYDCLNMDRENHIQGLLYGMPCGTMQNSICIIEKEDKYFDASNKINIDKSKQIIDYDIIETDSERTTKKPLRKTKKIGRSQDENLETSDTLNNNERLNSTDKNAKRSGIEEDDYEDDEIQPHSKKRELNIKMTI